MPKADATTAQGQGFIEYFGRAMRNSTLQVPAKPSDGLFLSSCYDHTTGNSRRIEGPVTFADSESFSFCNAPVDYVLDAVINHALGSIRSAANDNRRARGGLLRAGTCAYPIP